MSASTKHLATVRDLTGRIVHLGPFEEAFGLVIEQTRITLGINRAKVEHTYAGDHITKRGKQLIVFTLDPATGCWSATQEEPVWWSTDEMCVTRERRNRDDEWTDLCYRPGTHKTPLDSLDRQAQGYA
jgi:hypothetical protein